MVNFKEKTTPTTSNMIWATWLVASIFYAYQYILRVMPSVMMQDIMQQFDLDPVTFGQFSGIYYIGYALMHIPLGILLDRYGPKKIMPSCIMVTVIGLLPILLASNWSYAVIGRCLIGIGSSGAILSAFTIIRDTFGTARFTRMLSITVTIGLIGAIYGGGPMNIMCSLFGYKMVTLLMGVFGTILAAVAYVITPISQVRRDISVVNNIKNVFSSKVVWTICILAGLMVGPLEGFADVWGKQFLQIVFGFDSTVAASLISTIFFGMCFGAPVLSYICTKIGDEFITIIVSGILMTIGFIALLLGVSSASALSAIFAVVGVCCAYQILAIFKASTYVSSSSTGLTTAFANMIIMIFGYAFHSMIGLTTDQFGGITNRQALAYGISIIPVCLLIGTIGFGVLFWHANRMRFRVLSNQVNI